MSTEMGNCGDKKGVEYCSIHPKTEATVTCYRYPCHANRLCEECAALHFVEHGGKELERCMIMESRLAQLKLKCDKHEETIKQYEEKMTGITIPTAAKKCFEKIQENKLTVQILLEQLTNELKQMKAALNRNEIGPDPKPIEKIEADLPCLIQEINKYSELSTKFDEIMFFQLMGNDVSSIMPYYRLDTGQLCLVDLKLNRKVEKAWIYANNEVSNRYDL